MRSRTEVLMSRRQVEAEIKADPSTIIPIRQDKVPDGAGGWKLSAPTPRDPITVLITTAKRRLSSISTNTEMGDVVDFPYFVLARHDAVLRGGDTFTWQGDHFEVQSTHLDEGISLIAQVDYFGGSSNG